MEPSSEKVVSLALDVDDDVVAARILLLLLLVLVAKAVRVVLATGLVRFRVDLRPWKLLWDGPLLPRLDPKTSAVVGGDKQNTRIADARARTALCTARIGRPTSLPILDE